MEDQMQETISEDNRDSNFTEKILELTRKNKTLIWIMSLLLSAANIYVWVYIL